MSQTGTPAVGGRLAWPKLLTFSIVSLPVAMLGVAIGIFLPRYFASHLGVGLTAVGSTFAIVRLIDIPVDPFLGVAMDRTRTPLGRYRLWLLIGAPILMLAVHQLFMAPVGVTRGYLIVWILALYLGISTLGLAAAAWSAKLAAAYDERSRLFGAQALIAILGSIVVLVIPIVAARMGFSDAGAVRAMGWTLIGLTPVCIGLVAVLVPERVAAETRGGPRFALGDYLALMTRPALIRLSLAQVALVLGPGWMSALYLFFFKDGLGFSIATASGLLVVYVLAGVAGAPASAWLATRLGKHRTLMAATTAYSLGLCAILIMPRNNIWAVLPVMLWCGFAAAGFGLLIQSMTADVGDEVRLEQGRERISLIYSLISLAAKLAAAGSIFLTYRVLAGIGYRAVEGAHNTAQAIAALRWAFIAGPIVFVMLGGACFIGWRLDSRRHGEIRAALDAHDLALAEIAAAESLSDQAGLTALRAEAEATQ